MFDTFELQNLNKLVESEIGDFTSPEAFHTVKVKSFGGDSIKPSAQVRCKLPVKVFALVRDFPIQTGELTDSTAPTVRPFDFTRKTFVACSELIQGLFQRLWVLDLLTRAKRQICVFHTEVCPNTSTCCWQRFSIYNVCGDAKPIITTSVTFECYAVDVSVPLAVFEERKWHFIKPPLARISMPLTKTQRDTIIFQFPTRLSRKGDRLKLVFRFHMRSTPKFIEKTIVCLMNTFQFRLNRLARQCFPMRVCRLLAFRQVGTHCRSVRIRQPVLIPLTLPLVEIGMHLPHIVKQVPDTDTIRLMTKLILIRFHGLSRITLLTPVQVGRKPTRHQAVTLELSANVIQILYDILDGRSILFHRITPLAGLYPNA